MKLAVTRRGSTSARASRLTFVHGFTQTGRSWDPVVDDLAGDHECVCLDAPGHGDSLDGTRSLWQCADDIIDSSDGGVLVGYSMGARMALHAALAHPDRFTGLVLVSGTPGIEDEAEREARRVADEQLAERITVIGTERFIDEWLANPMFATLPPDMAMRNDRLRNRAEGLADSLRHAGTGTQQPLWSRLADIDVPVLIITGSLDRKFATIGERMAGLVPRATLVSIEGAGHTVHLEKPREFLASFRSWLADYESASTRPTA